MTPDLSAARCLCGSPEIAAIKPGLEPERRGAIDLFTRVDPLVERGAPDVIWCLPCWRVAHGVAGAGCGGFFVWVGH